MFGSLFGPDTRARSPTPPPAADTTQTTGTGDVIYTSGIPPEASPDDGGLTPTSGAVTQDNGKTYSLNFEGVDIATASKAILGDILKQPYSVDPRVVGQLSLSTARPINARDLLYVFESALAANSAALVKSGDGYHIVPSVEAQGAGETTVAGRSGQAEPGYGVSILPIRYVSITTLQQLMDGFSSRPGMMRIETSRNLLLIQGTGPERTTAMQAALTFDADWMRDQTVGVFPLKTASPSTVIGELEQIFETGDNGLGKDLIKFRPIERLNAVMAVSKRRELVQRAGAWINRLDASSALTPHVNVYQLRYGDAKTVAGILTDMFGGGGGATSPVAPDTGTNTGTSPPTAAAPQLDPNGLPVAGNTDTQPPPANTDTGTTGSSGGGSSGGNGIRITADTTNNTLVILADGATYKKMQSALLQIDRPRLQVAVHAIVAEVTLNDQLNNGIEFYLKSADLGLDGNIGSIGGATTEALKRVLPGFNFLIGPGSDPGLILHALESVTTVKVISSPSIVVTNNQQATLQVGSQVPVATRQSTAVTDPSAPIVNDIEFRDTGVILKVTPRISENGVVNMDIAQEVSAVTSQSTAGTLTPVISQRKVASQVSVVSGQTVVLGGMISEQSDVSSDGLPFINRMKFLGLFGGKRSNSHTRTEIIMFIRPEIIRDGQDAQNITDEMATELRNMVGPGSSDTADFDLPQ